MLKILLPIILMITLNVRADDFIPDSFSVTYTKNYQSPITKKEVTQKGSLEYLYPSFARLESNVTTETIFVLNHSTSWFFQGAMKETKEPAQVRISQSTPLPIMKALDSMKKSVDESPYFTRKNMGFNIVLTMKQDFSEESNIKEIQLQDSLRHSIKSMKDVKKLIITEVDGLVTTYEFSGFKAEKFDKEHFVFKVPKGAKVINEAQKQTAPKK